MYSDTKPTPDSRTCWLEWQLVVALTLEEAGFTFFSLRSPVQLEKVGPAVIDCGAFCSDDRAAQTFWFRSFWMLLDVEMDEY